VEVLAEHRGDDRFLSPGFVSFAEEAYVAGSNKRLDSSRQQHVCKSSKSG
jgi:hypothetical protein